MTHEQRAESIIKGRYIAASEDQDAIVQGIVDALTEVEELSAAAMVEKCAVGIYKFLYEDLEYSEPISRDLANHIRSLSPSGVLAEHVRQERLEEAEWWFKEWLRVDSVVTRQASEHIASLRQPTAEKDHHAD